jgi:hypothetical protein
MSNITVVGAVFGAVVVAVVGVLVAGMLVRSPGGCAAP